MKYILVTVMTVALVAFARAEEPKESVQKEDVVAVPAETLIASESNVGEPSASASTVVEAKSVSSANASDDQATAAGHHYGYGGPEFGVGGLGGGFGHGGAGFHGFGLEHAPHHGGGLGGGFGHRGGEGHGLYGGQEGGHGGGEGYGHGGGWGHGWVKTQNYPPVHVHGKGHYTQSHGPKYEKDYHYHKHGWQQHHKNELIHHNHQKHVTLAHHHTEHQKVLHRHHYHHQLTHNHHLHRQHIHNHNLHKHHIHHHNVIKEHIHQPIYHKGEKHVHTHSEAHKSKFHVQEFSKHAPGHKKEYQKWAPPVYVKGGWHGGYGAGGH